MPVEKLPTVITVEAEDRKRQRRFDLCDALLHQMLAAIPRCPALGPLRMDISQSNTPAKLPRHRFAAVGHRVGLDKPWASRSQCSVRMGIWLRNKVPGRVPQRPRAPTLARHGARSRSILAGLVAK